METAWDWYKACGNTAFFSLEILHYEVEGHKQLGLYKVTVKAA